jgi:2-polyprenyl-3-methyl-5-hydroxy-6-metoxy-1,4-benzoquinol methylase
MKQNKAQELAHAGKILHNPDFYWNVDTLAGKKGSLRRAQWISDTVKLKPGMRVLEIGCGTGFFSEIFVQSGAELHAIDLAKAFIKKALERCAGLGIHFKVADVDAMPYKDQLFDAVIGVRVLHHLDMALAFKEINRVLKPNGMIGFCEPNMLNPLIMLQKNIPWIKNKMGDTPDETAFFKWTLRRFLISCGYEQVRVQPFDFMHPWLPDKLVEGAERAGKLLESLPLIHQIAGSLQIVATKGPRKKSHLIHPGFRSSSPDPGVAKSSKELAIPPVLPPPDRTNLTQIRAPKM